MSQPIFGFKLSGFPTSFAQYGFVLLGLLTSWSLASVAMSYPCNQWMAEEVWPKEGQSNPLCVPPSQLEATRERGLVAALHYPVTVTGLLIPRDPIQNMLQPTGLNPLKYLFANFAQMITGFESVDDVYSRVGLYDYPSEEGEGIYFVPYPEGTRPDYPMGTSPVERHGETGITFGCASCHSGQVFGKVILGLNNRFPRANEFFILGGNLTSLVEPPLFKMITGANPQQTTMYRETVDALKYVETRSPQALSLDTSLAHVALSLSRRAKDEWASKVPQYAKKPRTEILRDQAADSKPAVWWNVKYKNKWLLDGSVRSGNPILTNILWNEIGRGTDLKALRGWIRDNQASIDDLTTAVYQSNAPHITDFFAADRIDLQEAKRGQKIYKNNCASCHGTYHKAWDLANAEELSAVEKLKTVRVTYHEDTPIYDVGTDLLRSRGMKSLEQLNDLAFSKEFGIKVKAQDGYVPPPLDGIWVRFPYMHNNSISSLCELLTPAAQRKKHYMARELLSPKDDFDFACNGYPTTAIDRQSSYYFNTAKPGLSAAGHDEGILSLGGEEFLSALDKKRLILFLQTL